MDLSTALLEVLSCPVSGGKLTYEPGAKFLISKDAGLQYPIIDDIPILLASAAKKIEESVDSQTKAERLESC